MLKISKKKKRDTETVCIIIKTMRTDEIRKEKETTAKNTNTQRNVYLTIPLQRNSKGEKHP